MSIATNTVIRGGREKEALSTRLPGWGQLEAEDLDPPLGLVPLLI